MADTTTKGTENDKVEVAEVSVEKLSEKQLNNEAHNATDAEHNITIRQALKTYNRAVFWSVLISTTVIMEGYDVTLLGSFMAYPAFKQRYGTYTDEEHGYQISASWQNALNVTGAVGNIIGAMLNGYLTAKFGHRRVIMGGMMFLSAFIFIVFFAPNTGVLLAGQFLCSIPWGAFATTGPAYAAEVSPVALRAYLTAYINLCWCIGQFISAGVLKGLVNNETQWAYRVPFAIQWIWPIPLGLAAFLAPESPWYLVRTGQLDRARQSLQRLCNPKATVDHDAALALVVQTNKLEKDEQAGVTYLEAFKGTNRRRTEIACMTFLSQVTNGGALCYSATFFFEQAGIGPSASYGIALGGTGVAFVGTILSWGVLTRFGRRPIWIFGLSFLVGVLYLIGILACVPNQTDALSYAQAALSVVWLGSYSMTVGPVVYTIVAEIGSTRMRTQTVVLGRSTYYIANIIGGVLQPRFMSPTAWNAKGKTAFFWGTTALLTTVWGFFRLPETKDRTFEEMDIMFQRRIASRQFASYDFNGEIIEARAST